MKYEPGQLVKVQTYCGQLVTRRVVSDLGRTVILCVEDEFQQAKRESREPDGVGFPRRDVSLK
jgi:hypothetical protein